MSVSDDYGQTLADQLSLVGPNSPSAATFSPDSELPFPPGPTPTATPIIPFNPALKAYENPLNHCSVRQVLRLLRGMDLSMFMDDEGSLETFKEELLEEYIPEWTGNAVRYMRTNYDWSKAIYFFDGTSGPVLTLPFREIAYVNLVMLRLLPSQIWYQFTRFRNIDGSAFIASGLTEPAQSTPMPVPPTSNSNTPYTAQVQYTGIEDADMFVDTRARSIIIPPRVLAASVATPFFNYVFFNGAMNVEVHFAYGFQPTTYTDQQPLVFDPVTGVMAPTSPTTGGVAGNAPVDWSSGMPKNLTNAVARLVYCDVLRKLWRSNSGGLSSMSVDGASESYGGKPFDVADEEKRAYDALQPFAIKML